MEEELDVFDFQLAESLNMTVRDMNERMGNDEYLMWRAYHVWHNAEIKLAADKARAEAKSGR